MKVIHNTASFGVKSGGGVVTCTYELLRALNANGCEASVISTVRPDESVCGNGEEWIKIFDNDCWSPLAFSRNLKRTLRASDADIYHSNGLWMYPNHISPSTARKKSRPYVISPHGMLYPEALKRSYWKKWVIERLWFDTDIKKATAMHATCSREAEHIRAYGYKGPIGIIPNLVVPPHAAAHAFGQREELMSDKPRRIGFLGRLHPRKGVGLLIEALELAKDKTIMLDILGAGDDLYTASLRRHAERLGIADRVNFAGYVGGDAKYLHLATLSALFVPSDFENFGMIVPEALLCGVPVVASKGTPWEALPREGCGWWIDREPDALAQVIDRVATAPKDELLTMGRRGRNYVLREFDPDNIARQMITFYESLL